MTDLFRESDPDVGHESEPAADGRSSSARSQRRRRAKRAAQRRRTLFTFIAMIAALGILVAGALIFLRPLLSGGGSSTPSGPTDYPGPGSGSVTIVVSPGDSGAAIGQTLVDADVVASVDAFVAAYSANTAAAGIQPGSYNLMLQMRAVDAVSALLDPASRADASITVPEGWRATQIYAQLAENMEVDAAEVEAAAAELTLPEEAQGVEGWLFPSTYTIAPDATPATVLQAMVDTTVQVLERNEIPRESWHDVIVTASIVEREVARDEDRENVAQVIENRLASCDGTGRLGMDSTLVYELDKPASEITQTEWGTASEYNTRQVTGLPPTAIASPGEASILAAANPPDGDYCYFVTVNLDTGETKFTGDYEEFQVFREEYQEWRDANR
ncbi:endolytic transglycosylase MltG [Pseudactinotalea suaedae]|uniref:endolytic transglycosylase MltG n=1 Tax=Pseudactinotalea suaedae TaxID=1524924 RepID=UPI0012E1AEDB|nr:endolytic transglycosylase MltG [Pseudactinotalea suaedae]